MEEYCIDLILFFQIRDRTFVFLVGRGAEKLEKKQSENIYFL